MQRRHFIYKIIATATIFSTLGACEKKNTSSATPVPAGATVIALGDSLTAGFGTTESNSYPTVLKSLTSWNVVNAGISGDKTTDVLARLPALLEQHRPALVLTGIGGNDTLRRLPESATRANIVNICQQIKASGAQQMLIAMPQFSLIGAAAGMLSDNPMYKSIAEEMNIPLQEGAWARILSDQSLRSDEIHANAQGYALFAELLVKSLREARLLNT